MQKKFGGRVHFYPTLPPHPLTPSPLCASMPIPLFCENHKKVIFDQFFLLDMKATISIFFSRDFFTICKNRQNKFCYYFQEKQVSMSTWWSWTRLWGGFRFTNRQMNKLEIRQPIFRWKTLNKLPGINRLVLSQKVSKRDCYSL